MLSMMALTVELAALLALLMLLIIFCVYLGLTIILDCVAEAYFILITLKAEGCYNCCNNMQGQLQIAKCLRPVQSA